MRRRACIAALGGLAAGAVASPTAPPTAEIWFDPTQLPSFSGRVQRWVMNPAGEIDRVLLREGVQIVMPATDAAEVMRAAPPEAALTVWGIRARSAPVVTMLAWARGEGGTPRLVAQPAWLAATARGAERLRVAGRIEMPLLNPQGEAIGVLLEGGPVVRLPRASHAALAELLRNGAPIAAEGPGTRRGEAVSLDAEQIGRDEAALRPVPTANP